MERITELQPVYRVTGPLGPEHDGAPAPDAVVDYEPIAMDFPEHTYAASPTRAENTHSEDDGYGMNLDGYKSQPTRSDMDAYFAWAEPQFDASPATQSFPTDDGGPEYLGVTGTDYSFVTPPTREEKIAEFRQWTDENPESTPADPIHVERLKGLYDTLDDQGNIAAAAAALKALKASRKAAENRAATMAERGIDPTRTSIINVADVVGGLASRQAVDKTMDFSAPFTDAPVQPEVKQIPSHRRPSGGRHRATSGGRHRAQ